MVLVIKSKYFSIFTLYARKYNTRSWNKQNVSYGLGKCFSQIITRNFPLILQFLILSASKMRGEHWLASFALYALKSKLESH